MKQLARQLRATVLVVDDEELSRELIVRILRDHGCTVIPVASAAEAYVELARDEIDLMLCDVIMPDESGPEFLARLKSEMPTLPVVMVSGVANTHIAQAALELGAYGYVTKPFTASQLLVAVANALHLRSLERENRWHRLHAPTVDDALDRSGDLYNTARPPDIVGPPRPHPDAMSVTLARAIEGRGIDSGDHVLRVARYARVVAEAVGLPAPQCEDISTASIFHDVGKIGVPAEVLRKAGRLTATERAAVETHAELGYRILSRSHDPALALAASIALTHHERWDGSGYPRGLAARAIPIEGRIVAVADVFDALVSHVEYRAPIEQLAALDIMRAGRGTQFDADVVDAFFDRVHEVIRVSEAVKDSKAS